MKLLKQKEFPLLSRTRYTYEVEHINATTPSEKELKEKIASLLKVSPDFVTVRHIFSKYGVGMCKVIVNVYNNPKTMKFFETKKEKKK